MADLELLRQLKHQLFRRCRLVTQARLEQALSKQALSKQAVVHIVVGQQQGKPAEQEVLLVACMVYGQVQVAHREEQ